MAVETAILLAAGLGTRMRPLTDDTPKPLLSLAGRRLIDYALDRFAAAGVAQVAVNTHYLGAQIASHLAARGGQPRTVLRPEPALLDTGGAVAAALAAGVVGPGPFFVANSDSLWLDGPVPALDRLEHALDETVDGVMLLHRTFQVQADVGKGDFFLDPFGMPRRRNEREIAPYIYGGVMIARPALFAGMAGSGFSMNLVWDRALQAGRLRGVVHDGLWFHMSRPADLAEAEHALFAQLTGQST